MCLGNGTTYVERRYVVSLTRTSRFFRSLTRSALSPRPVLSLLGCLPILARAPGRRLQRALRVAPAAAVQLRRLLSLDGVESEPIVQRVRSLASRRLLRPSSERRHNVRPRADLVRTKPAAPAAAAEHAVGELQVRGRRRVPRQPRHQPRRRPGARLAAAALGIAPAVARQAVEAVVAASAAARADVPAAGHPLPHLALARQLTGLPIDPPAVKAKVGRRRLALPHHRRRGGEVAAVVEPVAHADAPRHAAVRVEHRHVPAAVRPAVEDRRLAEELELGLAHAAVLVHLVPQLPPARRPPRRLLDARRGTGKRPSSERRAGRLVGDNAKGIPGRPVRLQQQHNVAPHQRVRHQHRTRAEGLLLAWSRPHGESGRRRRAAHPGPRCEHPFRDADRRLEHPKQRKPGVH
mmetsp:Transcript_41623/g.134962  ORF Transcript_41623/g.134962 Transcript_41623/m.134962 type:complete len:407 (+) Transcript_41623:58-1278(+)